MTSHIRILVKVGLIAIIIIPLIVLAVLLPVSFTRSHLLYDEWSTLERAFMAISKRTNGQFSRDAFAELARQGVLKIKIGFTPSTKQALYPADKPDGNQLIFTYGALETPPTQNQLPTILILELFISLPLIFLALWAHRRFYKRPINDLINTLLLIADDPTIIQPVPKSLRSNDDLKKVGQAIEVLQINMLREYRQRERLADIGEAVTKINHDTRNVLSSATLVSDALLQSDDANVRKSAPLILHSLEQAVDLCQSMLDYLAQTPRPKFADFDLPELLGNIQQASLLTLHYQGPQVMHADRAMMQRILLNLARNAGTAGATELWIEVWQVGHLALVDISDNGIGIPRENWADLFFPFRSRQGSGGGLGLAISRDLAVAHGGMLRLSRSSHEGSEFRIQFPITIFPTLQTQPVLAWHVIPAETAPPLPQQKQTAYPA